MTTEKIENVHGEVTVSQDRLEITDGSMEADTYIKPASNTQPLSKIYPVVEIITHTENGCVDLQLNGQQLEQMIEALQEVQEHYD